MTVYSSSEKNSLSTPACHSACCFVCSIVYPAEWYIAVALPVVRKWSHPSLQSRELRTLWTESKLWSYEEGDHLCRNSYFMFLHWEPSFLSCLEWKSKSHRTSSFLSLDSCWRNRMQSIENTLNTSRMEWSFSCLFWISDVILCWPAVTALWLWVFQI